MFTSHGYLSPTGGCKSHETALLNWLPNELQRCEYTVLDTSSSTRRFGLVYLANPGGAKIFDWVFTACQKASPKAALACIRRSARAVRDASGGQFPVAGLVLEDMDGSGTNKGYVFRNGVTVHVKGFKNGSADTPSDGTGLEALATNQSVEGVNAAGGYARVLSTTRADYARFSGRSDVPVNRADSMAALLWSDMVGEIHRASLGSKENALITSTVCAQYGFPATCKP